MQGDLTCLPDYCSLLDDKPELWKEIGDFAVHAELSLLSLCAGNNLLLNQAALKTLDSLKTDLAPSPPPLGDPTQTGLCHKRYLQGTEESNPTHRLFRHDLMHETQLFDHRC